MESGLGGLNQKMSAERRLTLRVRKSAPPLLEKLKALKAVLRAESSSDGWIELDLSSDRSANEQVAEIAVQGGFGLLEMREAGFNLEDVFIRLISDKGEEEGEASSVSNPEPLRKTDWKPPSGSLSSSAPVKEAASSASSAAAAKDKAPSSSAAPAKDPAASSRSPAGRSSERAWNFFKNSVQAVKGVSNQALKKISKHKTEKKEEKK